MAEQPTKNQPSGSARPTSAEAQRVDLAATGSPTAMRYICRAGCQWRCLPTCFPPWSAVYYFRRWQLNGL